MVELFNTDGDNKGPAILDRDPVLLPNERKRVAERVKQRVGSSDNEKMEQAMGDKEADEVHF